MDVDYLPRTSLEGLGLTFAALAAKVRKIQGKYDMYLGVASDHAMGQWAAQLSQIAAEDHSGKSAVVAGEKPGDDRITISAEGRRRLEVEVQAQAQAAKTDAAETRARRAAVWAEMHPVVPQLKDLPEAAVQREGLALYYSEMIKGTPPEAIYKKLQAVQQDKQ